MSFKSCVRVPVVLSIFGTTDPTVKVGLSAVGESAAACARAGAMMGSISASTMAAIRPLARAFLDCMCTDDSMTFFREEENP